jgi:hypothetical protein
MTPVRGLSGACFTMIAAGLLAATPRAAPAQSIDTVLAPTPPVAPHYWRNLTLGAVSSILLHEAGHISVALIFGHHPTFGFDEFRPTIYSGIITAKEPHKQFLFSAAGLTVQNVLDEAILNIPHNRGSAFERGVLGGGIGTTVFYLTIGRTGSVSDVDFMARTRALNKLQITAIFGGMSAMHAFRMSRDPRYANFFARPGDDGGLDVGLNFRVR